MTQYIPLLNGTNIKIGTGNCDGTLLTEKIVLTAAHCCKFQFNIQIALTMLFPEECTVQKCKDLILSCLREPEPQKPGCKWVDKLETLAEECKPDRLKCIKQAEECISNAGPQVPVPKKCHWIRKFMDDPMLLPKECNSPEELKNSCNKAVKDCRSSGCDKAREVEYFYSLTKEVSGIQLGQLLPFKEVTVQSG